MAYADSGDYDFLATGDQLKQHIERLKKEQNTTIQMRFPAQTSLNGNKSVILIFPHIEKKYLLLVPYNKELYVEKRIVMKEQKISEVASFGILRETRFRFGDKKPPYDILGNPIEVKNSNPFATVPHKKYVIGIKDYFMRNDYESVFDRNTNSKSGIPLWVSEHLLSEIFEEAPDGIPHPQLEPYRRGMEWYNKRKYVIA